MSIYLFWIVLDLFVLEGRFFDCNFQCAVFDCPGSIGVQARIAYLLIITLYCISNLLDVFFTKPTLLKRPDELGDIFFA
jgi:hypothetical protein